MNCGINVFIVLLPWNLNSHLGIQTGMQLSQKDPEPGFCPVPPEGTHPRGSSGFLCNKHCAKLPLQTSAGLKHCRGPVKSFSREIFSWKQHQNINQTSKYQSGISSQKYHMLNKAEYVPLQIFSSSFYDKNSQQKQRGYLL